MNVYLSARSSDLAKARAAMERLHCAGHTITHDWTRPVELHEAEPGNDETLAACGRADIEGVIAAEVVVVLINSPHGPGTGAAVEMGAAFATGRSVILVETHGPVGAWARHPFRLMASARVESLKDALVFLKLWGR